MELLSSDNQGVKYFCRSQMFITYMLWVKPKQIYQNNDLDNLDGLVDEYNNTYYYVGSITVDTGHSTLPEELESNKNVPKFSVGDRARIIKYKNIFS